MLLNRTLSIVPPTRWLLTLILGASFLIGAPTPIEAARSRRSLAKKKVAKKKAHRAKRARIYRCRRGDTLRRVAHRFRVPVRSLRRLNPRLRRLRSTRRLRPGRRLRLPRQRPSRYRFVQMTDGPGYKVLRPERAWGTLVAVTRLQDTFAAYARRFPEAQPLVIHDLSRRRGGRMRPHRSHRTGRDVDIRVPLNYRTTRYVRATARTIDIARTWYVLRTMLDTNDVEYIFLDRRLQVPLYRYAREQGATEDELARYFQYPARVDVKRCKRGTKRATKGKAKGPCRPRRQRGAIIRHERGHADHFHIRFHRTRRPALPLS